MFSDLQTSHLHSPGLGLNKSASEVDWAAPGLGASHDEHLDAASALFSDLQTSHLHSPGLGLNKSASDGWPLFTPFEVGVTASDIFELEAPFPDLNPSSSSNSLLPEGSKDTFTFFSGHWNLVGTPALAARARFCSSLSWALDIGCPLLLPPAPFSAAFVPKGAT